MRDADLVGKAMGQTFVVRVLEDLPRHEDAVAVTLRERVAVAREQRGLFFTRGVQRPSFEAVLVREL